ncbi:MAG: Vitamin B12 dependent methionine synthase activation subunit [Peptococcaceae bacterium]|nr:Vitamin B12 dependent methionine synthase activation subunit [Peptococcaceae bacterium]
MYGLMNYYRLEVNLFENDFSCAAWNNLSGAGHPSSGALAGEMLEEARQLARIEAVLRTIPVSKTTDGQVFLEGGRVLTSSLLARLAGPARDMLLAIVTLGHAIDRRVEDYQRDGLPAHAYFLDVAGTCLIEAAGRQLVNLIKKQVQSAGLETTIPLGPGHSYWKNLLDQRTIYDLLDPRRLGVTVLESGLMLPKKSLSMVAGIGRGLPPSEENHCYYCSSGHGCPLSRAGPRKV